jgi:hypothetical protein
VKHFFDESKVDLKQIQSFDIMCIDTQNTVDWGCFWEHDGSFSSTPPASPADLVDSNIHWMVAVSSLLDLRSSLMGNQNHKSQILGKHHFPPLKLLLSKKHTV